MLRIYLGVFGVAHVDFMTGYRIDAWLAWLPNLLLAELFILRRPASQNQPAARSSLA